MSDEVSVVATGTPAPAWERIEESEALDRGWTLPADWYTDPHIFDRELDRIFGREWQYAGHASRVPEPGSYFTTMVGRVPVVVVRRADGELAAHVNVCPHRAHPVALGSGCSKSLQCHYHGWTFALDGTLRGAPRSDREDSFDAGAVRLRPVQVDTWGPLIFVNPELETPPLAAALGGLAGLVAERGVDLNRHPLRATRQWEIKCNWKLTLDNNTECYHCATVHPGFRSEYHVDRDNYRITAFERSFAHISSHKDGHEQPAGWDDFHVNYLFPNFMLSGRGNEYFYTYTYVPVDAQTTVQHNDYFFPESYSDAEVDEAVEDIAQIMREDWAVFERVQVGLRSGMIAHGRLLKDEERLLRHFQRLCHAAVTD
jgi:phenylpropionate dioxygenase-like ring-hydroxylating dioxygenase large terminal subunit